ncbi:hypothetical protein V2G26_020627 [Clonostachys chloroleuca]|uniref:E3 SUMO-protein ligase pli1 n=1 Tax=Clonostachys chloroleuca TaxID=1926264 RepID=A0AA35LXU6_9HYPO|nr:unnamed protein product [Clonostachys chloroleuca]
MAAPPPTIPGITSISRTDYTTLIRQVSGATLFNRQLASICQINGLKSTGVKAELQGRIRDLIQEAYNANDATRFQQIRQSIYNAMSQRSSPQKQTPRTSTPQMGLATPASHNGTLGQNGFTNQHATPGYTSAGVRQTGFYPSSASPALLFKQSPFYHLESQISEVLKCPVMTQHRSSVHLTVRLTDNLILQRCVDDPSYRVMLFGSTENSGVQDIAFPHQSELKINGGEFKANLRGLKNKPGSTRPVDITSALRLKSSYTNNIEFTYALTNKTFYVVLFVCKTSPVSDLVMEIQKRRRIPKDSVITELNQKAQDPDVVACSQVFSLKCPLSYMRLDVPCRTINCGHIQCFDATSYLQLQEQGPQWMCPICNKPAPYEHLAVDEYVRDILDNTSKSLETVTIEPNGRWTTKSTEPEQYQPSGSAAFEDDDEVEISDITIIGGYETSKPAFSTNVSTPASAHVGGSSGTPRGAGSISNKRPAAEVIDLTLSSDDEEPVQRAPKRQNTSANGYQESHGMGFLSESPLGYPQ